MAIYFMPRKRVKPMLARELPEKTVVCDVSGDAKDGWDALSPLYDHGNIPVPGMPGVTSRTMEGIWQGLKRFEFEGEDLTFFNLPRPKKRRAGGTRGKSLGHLYKGETLNNEVEARIRIYFPAYQWMINHCPAAKAKFEELVELSRNNTVHVYDFEENGDVHNPLPYAHAALLRDLVTAELKQKVNA